MYTGFKANSAANKTALSRQSQTQLETLQRQVDNYTRKLEQQKKKYFSIQDQYKIVSAQYQKQKQRLNQLKKEASKASNLKVQAKVKNLQANLDKAIGIYDDTISHNNKLKKQIDMLRRQKKSFLDSHKLLEQKIKKYEDESTQKLALIEKKKRKCDELKNEMFEIKQKNQEERQQYIKQFDNLQKEYMQEKRERQSFKFEKNFKPQSIDTQPLLKFRLKKIMKTNKDKMKMIQNYKKHMRSIEQAFQQIKAKSGIQDLDQITNTFIQSEQQNYSLYNYMDSLSQNIDSLEEKNLNLQSQIKLQQKKDVEKKKDMQNTPDEEKKKNQLQLYIEKKQETNKELTKLINQIRPNLSSSLKLLAKSCLNDNPQKVIDYELEMNITERTIQHYLADLQKYINNLLIIKQEAKTKIVSNMKESATTYSRPIPGINNDDVTNQKQNQIREQGKFLQQNKFRDYAIEFWEKKRNKGKQ